MKTGFRRMVQSMTILIGLLGVFAWASWDQLGNLAHMYLPETATSLRGQWVGILDVEKPSASLAKKSEKAVIRIDFRGSNAALGIYEGKGELFIEGEKNPRPLKLTFVREKENGTVNAMVECEGINFFDGKKSAGMMAVKLQGIGASPLKVVGMLYKGDDAEYQALRMGLGESALPTDTGEQ
ncbi:Hypothetical protein LUCI_0424 [Lucifera butyrica]|uniref:Uncharacterized protein n=2 Tax=Lucifera butyrica TaxID=1351585 RepID=A0A498R314_9FIRM|nr:Hypothetical protein LUCI_0424 [Lucifera butyrica]